MIQGYQELFNQDRPDIHGICMSLDKFVGFIGEDHDDIIVKGRQNITFKAESKDNQNLFWFYQELS